MRYDLNVNYLFDYVRLAYPVLANFDYSKSWNGDPDMQVGVYFKAKEFLCDCKHCSHDQIIIPSHIAILDEARFVLGAPMIITSGVRCDKRNAEVGGVPDSRHLIKHKDGTDITTRESRMGDLEKIIYAHPRIKAIGLYDGRFHVDSRANEGDKIIWDNRSKS